MPSEKFLPTVCLEILSLSIKSQINQNLLHLHLSPMSSLQSVLLISMEQLSTVFSRQESDLNGSKRLLTITLHKSSSSFSSCFPLSMQVKNAEPKVNVAKADLTWCDIYLYQFDIFITLKCWQSSAWGCQAPAPGKPRPQSWRDSEWLSQTLSHWNWVW